MAFKGEKVKGWKGEKMASPTTLVHYQSEIKALFHFIFLMFFCQKRHVFMAREERGKGEKMAAPTNLSTR